MALLCKVDKWEPSEVDDSLRSTTLRPRGRRRVFVADIVLVATVISGHHVCQMICEVVIWRSVPAKKVCLCLCPVIHHSVVGLSVTLQ